jgi:hypothetical protein
MKKKLAIFMSVFVALVALAATSPPAGDVMLEWVQSTPASTNKMFKLYGSPTISAPLTNWTVLTNISGLATNVSVRIVPGVYFFSITESNLWGESSFSVVVQSPPLPLAPTLSIKAAN